MRKKAESGFALLFVYAMAATIAISLYMELPRVAFEAQRDKEQLLVDRGEQYSRAITLYVRKFNRYPADFEALENTQSLRFLRNRYVDPMTGKEEWRLIHVGPGGVFTDSLVYNKKKDDGTKSEPQNFITETQQTGGNQVDTTQGVNLAGRVRPSDQPGAPGDPNNPQAALPQSPLPQSGLIQPGLPQFDANGQPIPNTGQMPGLPPGMQFPPGMQLPPGVQLPPGAQFPQAGQFPNGTNPNVTNPNLANPNMTNPGANLIGQLLTSPRPGGLNGTNGQQPSIDQYGNPAPGNSLAAGGTPAGFNTPAAATNTTTPVTGASGGQTIGGGVAGVASKREQEGIKLYGDRKKYNEWEFVYDVNKDKTRGGGATIPTPPGLNGPGAQQPGAATAQPQQATPQTQQLQPTAAPPIPSQ